MDKPGNTPVHGGLTGFGKVRRLTMIWNNNQRHSSFPVIYPFKWLWTLGCPPKAKLISVTYPLKSSCLCILGSRKNQIFISKIDQLQHMVKIWEFYKVKLAKDKPKICNFQNLVITFDWGVLLTQGQRVWLTFCKIFSGIPNLTKFVVPKYAPQIPYFAYLAVFGHIWVRIWAYQTWSSGVSLKRS